jgi:phage terminase small subunit
MTKKPAKKSAPKKAKAKRAKAKRAKAKRARKAAPPPRKLTALQDLFCREYIVDLNGTQAAIRAGFSAKTAHVQAHDLLKNPLVVARIDELRKERLDRLRLDADSLLMRLCEEADADIADLFDAAGALLPVHEWPAVWRKGLVAGIEVVSINAGNDEPVEEELEPQGHGGALKRSKKPPAQLAKIKLSDRLKRLELIGRHVNVQAWRDKKVHEVGDTLKDFVRQVQGNAIRPQVGGEGK